MKEFLRIMDLSDEEFRSEFPNFAKLSIADVLNVPESVFPKKISKNVTKSISGVRAIFKFPWVNRGSLHTVDHLLDYSATCIFCHKTGAKMGALKLIMDVYDKHAATKGHIKKSKKLRQQQLGDFGVTQEMSSIFDERMQARHLAVGTLLSGGNGAGPIPPYAISSHLNQDFLTVCFKFLTYPLHSD